MSTSGISYDMGKFGSGVENVYHSARGGIKEFTKNGGGYPPRRIIIGLFHLQFL